MIVSSRYHRLMIKVACDEEDVESEVKESVELLQVCERGRVSPLDTLFGLMNLGLALVKADKSEAAVSMLNRLLELWEVSGRLQNGVLFFLCYCCSPSRICTASLLSWKRFWRRV